VLNGEAGGHEISAPLPFRFFCWLGFDPDAPMRGALLAHAIASVALTRNLFAICVSYVIVQVLDGRFSRTAKLLESKAWTPIARVSYSAYLLQGHAFGFPPHGWKTNGFLAHRLATAALYHLGMLDSHVWCSEWDVTLGGRTLDGGRCHALTPSELAAASFGIDGKAPLLPLLDRTDGWHAEHVLAVSLYFGLGIMLSCLFGLGSYVLVEYPVMRSRSLAGCCDAERAPKAPQEPTKLKVLL